MNFYRSTFATLWIRLQSNESLGLLDSDYIEDYHGADGQITLHHVDTATDYPVLMSPVPDETPQIDHDVLRGPVTLSTLPDGLYQIRGRVRDTSGNYTILSDFATPTGGETVQSLQMTILPGLGYRYALNLGVLSVFGAFAGGSLAPPKIRGKIGDNLILRAQK